MKKYVLVMILFTAFVSCSKKEFGYNEKMSSLFLNCMEKVDENYERLNNGSFDGSKEFELKNAKGIATYAAEMKAESEYLTPSDDAKPFHDEVLKYFDMIEKQYAPLFVSYVEATDANTKIALKAQIEAKFKDLEQQATTTQEVQKVYFEKAGLSAK